VPAGAVSPGVATATADRCVSAGTAGRAAGGLTGTGSGGGATFGGVTGGGATMGEDLGAAGGTIDGREIYATRLPPPPPPPPLLNAGSPGERVRLQIRSPLWRRNAITEACTASESSRLPPRRRSRGRPSWGMVGARVRASEVGLSAIGYRLSQRDEPGTLRHTSRRPPVRRNTAGAEKRSSLSPAPCQPIAGCR
jgi:hypothetical protein